MTEKEATQIKYKKNLDKILQGKTGKKGLVKQVEKGLIEVFWAWRIPVISLMEHKAVTKAMRSVSEMLFLPFVEEFVQKLSLLF